MFLEAMRHTVHRRAAWLTGDDLDLVMGRAFCYWIGWKLPET
jgi:hypothetical protein